MSALSSGGARGRRVGDGWDAGARRVLIGLADIEAAGLLAKGFAEGDILPTLVFSCEQLAREAREDAYGLIVLDARLVCEHDSRCLQEVREGSGVPLIALGAPHVEGVDVSFELEHDMKTLWPGARR